MAKTFVRRPWPEQSWVGRNSNGAVATSRCCSRSGYLGTLHVQSAPRYRVIHPDEDEGSPLLQILKGRPGFGLKSQPKKIKTVRLD